MQTYNHEPPKAEVVARLKQHWIDQARAANPALYRDEPAKEFPQLGPGPDAVTVEDETEGFPIWGVVFALLFGLALLFVILLFCLVILPEAYRLYFKVCGC
jgi:hypothetical protein